MATTRQWDILNKPELDRIAQELCHYSNLLSSSGKMLLPEVVAVFKAEVENEIRNSSAASSANRGVLSYFWRTTANPSAAPILEALAALSNAVNQQEYIERLRGMKAFIAANETANSIYNDRFISALIKKHPHCPQRLANQPLPEEAIARVKETLMAELSKVLEVSKSIPKPPPAPRKEQIDQLSAKRSSESFFKVAESSVIDELRDRFASGKRKPKAPTFASEVERLSRIDLS